MNFLSESEVHSRKNVAIIVTTYHPDLDDFESCIKSYVKQAGLVVVSDNTECIVIHNALSKFLAQFHNVHFISMSGNKGIAKAQNIGMKYALEQGFESFIEMDQDSSLSESYVEDIQVSYNNALRNNPRVAGIGPLAVKGDGTYYHSDRKANKGLIKVDKTLSSGFFLTKDIYNIVGIKSERLFIDYVDWEWCWRAGYLGYSTYIDTSLEIQHKLGEGHKKILFWEVGVPSPIRHYYQYRNACLLSLLKYIPLKWKLQRMIIHLFKVPVYLLIFDRPLLRLRYVFFGIKDFILNRTGRIGNDSHGK